MLKIGILFDIEELESGLYGYAAYKIFFEVVDIRQLAGCSLRDGDTNATLIGRANHYCIAVESTDASKIAVVKNALSWSNAKGLLPLKYRFIEDVLVSNEPLVLAAHISTTGELVGCQTSWVKEAWEKYRVKHLMAGPTTTMNSAASTVTLERANTPKAIAHELPTNWKIGDKIQNRWEIYNILGGGMGIVYIVYDHETREPFAAKTFQDQFIGDDIARARFTQEALAWVKLDIHQDVVQARFVEKVQGKPLVFLEYVSGGDLSRWINTPRLTQDLPQVLRFAIQFCDGMSHAFSKGIKVHRDIKPQNCLITQDNTLKVTDFGLAKVFDDSNIAEGRSERTGDKKKKHGKWLGGLIGKRHADHLGQATSLKEQSLSISLSHTGMGAGTRTHMAPEQFDDAKHVDVRADVYSFGVMLFQMITGRLPFVGRTWEDFARLHKTQPPPKLKSPIPNLESFIHTCLDKSPARRFTDFGMVREPLVEMYEGLTGKSVPQPATGAELNSVQCNDKGVSLNNLGRSEEAIVCFDHALALYPSYENAWNNKGVALYDLQRYAEATDCCNRTLEINPQSAGGWTNKGLALRAMEKPTEALYCLNRALELSPHDIKSLINMGSMLVELGRREEALTYYDRALELDPRNAEAWTSKGGALRVLKRLEEAIACHNRALELNPRSADAWSNKGAVLRVLGRHDEAIASYDRALEINPRFEMAWYNKGTALTRLEQYEAAITCFDHALELNPRLDRVWVNKGIALRELQRYQEALDCFDRPIKLNLHYAEAWFNKGSLLVDIFQSYREALPYFEEAQRLGLPQAGQGIALCRQMLK